MTMMTSNVDTRPSYAGASRRKIGFFGRLLTWQAVHKERQSLSQLDARLLDDLGISPQEAHKEAKRPLWDAPQRWLR